MIHGVRIVCVFNPSPRIALEHQPMLEETLYAEPRNHTRHRSRCGHNRRVQQGSVVLHGEMDALENAGRQPASVYRECTIYTTLSPCPMCTGAILLYGIPRVVVGENVTFQGDEALLRSRGVRVDVLQDAECIQLMTDFIAQRPELWNEDIGE